MALTKENLITLYTNLVRTRAFDRAFILAKETSTTAVTGLLFEGWVKVNCWGFFTRLTAGKPPVWAPAVFCVMKIISGGISADTACPT